MKTQLLFVLTILNLNSALAQPTTVPEIGSHYPIFKVEKNENPENIMIVYTKLDANCHLQVDSSTAGNPVFDFYWLMNRQTYKPVNSLIKSSVKDRLRVAPANNSDTFMAQLNDLKEVDSDIRDPRLTVTSEANSQGQCQVHPYLTLGPSD